MLGRILFVAFDLRALRYFVYVAEHGNMTRASRALNIVQPALTQQMANLENHLGVQLLVRSPQGVKLTPEGQELLASAQEILAQVRSVEERLSHRSGELDGWLTLGISRAAAQVMLKPLVRRVMEQHPQLRLRIAELRTPDILDGLLAGQLDLGITASAGENTRIRSTLLAEETMYLVGSASEGLSGTIAFEEVMDRPFVLSYQNNTLPFPDSEASRRGRPLDVVLMSSSADTNKELIAEGGLFGIMTWASIADCVETGRLSAAKIVDPVFPKPTFLCQMHDRQYSQRAKAVSKIIVDLADDLTRSATFR